MKSSENSSQIKYRSDYQPSPYLIESTALVFQLKNEGVLVKSRLQFISNPLFQGDATTLKLDGERLQLQSLFLNGIRPNSSQYQLLDDGILLKKLEGKAFIFESQVKIHPETNTLLEGLYRSGGKFCTQCEAQGFRHITYYLDRPDVLSLFTTRVEADKSEYPSLLSNGNCVEKGDLEDGQHYAVWQDPFPKPCYLFALVAGDFDLLEDHFDTLSGRRVSLQIFVDKGHLHQCHHAMVSLKNAMKWDEEKFGREYDLDIFMVVAVGDFNMGAMENKGLNIFNTKYVLADDKSATDDDFLGIESVIGHEYFHNWTGNRITCRDWFQLSLKEGLTVFRDQQFSADLNSSAVKRIQDVQVIRSAQFAEDAGPMAHPIRPDSYIEMNNFYTVTVYNKGAEVIRMMHTLLGAEGFRQGMDHYFEAHDGHAVTCEDYVKALETATSKDLAQFRHWYSQAGTPTVTVADEVWDEHQQSLRITLKQETNTITLQQNAPFVIPIKLALLNAKGEDMLVSYQQVVQSEFVIELNQSQQIFEFHQVTEKPLLSYLRDFSAPVKLSRELTDDQLAFLMGHDNNTFSCWDAGQQLMSRVIWSLYDEAISSQTDFSDETLNNYSHTLKQAIEKLLSSDIDPSFIALAISLPSVSTLEADRAQMDIVLLDHLRNLVRKSLGSELHQEFLKTYQSMQSLAKASISQQQPLSASAGYRKLANVCLGYLTANKDEGMIKLARTQYEKAQNMTDELAAFTQLVDAGASDSQWAIADFYKHWQKQDLVIDKWLSIQAMFGGEPATTRVDELWAHPAVVHTNPNKVRALIAAFTANIPAFHAIDGTGYKWLADRVLEMDDINPQITARLVSPFNRWRKYDHARQQLIKSQLERILRKPNLSKDVYEIVNKSYALMSEV